MSEDDLNSFTLALTEFLDPLLPPTNYMGSFFDTDDHYIPLNEFIIDWFERRDFITKERNFN